MPASSPSRPSFFRRSPTRDQSQYRRDYANCGVFAQDVEPDDEGVHILQGILILVQVKDSNEFLAYSKNVGKWNKFTFPDGVTAVPVFSNGLCAFEIAGDNVTEIVAVDLQGNWCKFKLPGPAKKCTPIISDKVAVFVVDGKAHAFSAALGKWDSVEAPVEPQVHNDTALIVTSDWIAAFSAASGKWAVTQRKKKT